MKKITTLLALLMLTNFNSYSQNKGGGLAVAAGVIAGAAAAVAIMDQIEEELELFATEYVIENYNYDAFELKIEGLSDGAKNSDPSSVSVVAFNITPLDYEFGNYINDKRSTLLVFFDSGWRNEFGIDITKVKFKTFSKEEWNGVISKYIELASGAVVKDGKVPNYSTDKKDDAGGNVIKSDGKEYYFTGRELELKFIQFGRRGLQNGNRTVLPYKNIKGDSYFVTDYNNDFKIIFNEKSLGLFLKDIGRLVQIKSSLLDKITAYLNLY